MSGAVSLQPRVAPVSRAGGHRVRYWLRKAGIDKAVSPHGLRHTFATHLYAATSDILVIKRALGHQDISTTEIYIHLVDDALEKALEWCYIVVTMVDHMEVRP